MASDGSGGHPADIGAGCHAHAYRDLHAHSIHHVTADMQRVRSLMTPAGYIISNDRSATGVCGRVSACTRVYDSDRAYHVN